MKEEIINHISGIMASLNMIFVCGYENCGNMTSSIERLAKLREYLQRCEIIPEDHESTEE